MWILTHIVRAYRRHQHKGFVIQAASDEVSLKKPT